MGCKKGLECLPEVGEAFGLSPSDGVCLPTSDPDLCSEERPCREGEGLCAMSSECQEFLTCKSIQNAPSDSDGSEMRCVKV